MLLFFYLYVNSLSSYEYANAVDEIFPITLAFSIDKQTKKAHKETAWHGSLCNSHVPEQIYHQLP